MDSDNDTTIGPGLEGTLFIVFLVLKITGVIDWSWWWFVGAVMLYIIIAIIYVIWRITDQKKKNNNLSRDLKETKFLIKLHQEMEKNEKLSKLN